MHTRGKKPINITLFIYRHEHTHALPWMGTSGQCMWLY